MFNKYNINDGQYISCIKAIYPKTFSITETTAIANIFLCNKLGATIAHNFIIALNYTKMDTALFFSTIETVFNQLNQLLPSCEVLYKGVIKCTRRII